MNGVARILPRKVTSKLNPRVLLLASVAFLIAATYTLNIDENGSQVDDAVNEALVYEWAIHVNPKPRWPWTTPRIGDKVVATFRNGKATFFKLDDTTAGYEQAGPFVPHNTGGGPGGGGDCNPLQ